MRRGMGGITPNKKNYRGTLYSGVALRFVWFVHLKCACECPLCKEYYQKCNYRISIFVIVILFIGIVYLYYGEAEPKSSVVSL